MWASVAPAGAGAVPSERREAGTVTLTRPDKRTRTIEVPWPTDGLTSRGWTQAVVVDGETPQQGEYRAVFTHAGRESAGAGLRIGQPSAEFKPTTSSRRNLVGRL